MVIKWLGHASFIITTIQGTRILTDPYQSGAYNGAIRYGEIREKVDLITVSHSHADHNFVKGISAQKIIEEARDFRFKDVSICGVNTYHDEKQGKLRGTNIIFIIEADSLRVTHLGDLGTTNIDYSKLKDIDIILIPVGGNFTIGPKEAKLIVEKINPRIVIPMHFKTPKVDFDIQPVDDFLEVMKDKLIRKGLDALTIDKDSLPSSTEIMVLNHLK